MGDRTTIKDVFVQCQTGLQGHGKLIKTLGKIYEKTEFPSFWSEFSHYLKYALLIIKREPAVERMIDFTSKFVTSITKNKLAEQDDEDNSKDEEADSVESNQLLQEMFDFLLKTHSARDKAVRFRCCQLVNKLLINLGEDAQIDDDLYDRLYECMLERLKDKCPLVRYHAVMAMSRLQDPSDENCPVIRAYLFLLNCDPNWDVRRAVLSSIAPSTKTLASIIGRTRDVKDTVRMTAYEVLAEKIHIKAMSIALRLQLLHEGLNDRSEMVQKACRGKLLQTWMRTFNGDILGLLKSLDVEDSTDICANVLTTLFKSSTDQDVVDGFVKHLSENLLVPDDQLTCEIVLYWQVVCKYIHGLGNEGDVYLEKLLPSCVDFCAYVQRYVDELQSVEDPEIQLGREFIIEQLLLIASYMDTADTASRKAFEVLLHNMLIADHVSHRLVVPIVKRICELRGTGENIVPYFAETVSDIREPITLVEKDVEAEQKRQINLKIAGIRVSLNQLKEDLDTAVKDQDFTKAAEIKASIAELDAEKASLLESSEPAREEIRTERNDPLTLLKCQTIICEMLQNLKLSQVSSTLQMMIESQIVPGIQNADADVRSKAMQALGLCCYLNKDLLLTYTPLFMQASQIDVEIVRVTALQVMFDALLVYGLDIVDASEASSSPSENPDTEGNSTDVTSIEDSVSVSSKTDSRTGTASKLVAIICSFLDGDSTELRTCAAEGLSKLLMSGRVVSSKILSHLILLWYNPLSEDHTHLRDCLGTFFPLYALAGRSNQEVVEDAFIPTLRTLLNAPPTSPLIEVNVNNVAELLVQLTNSKLIRQNQSSTETSQDNTGHDNVSEKVCNEILSDPESPNVKLWVKILNQMEVSPDNEVVLKDLRVLCYRMLKVVKEKLCRKNLEKFQGTINGLVEKFLSGGDDLLQLIEAEPEPEPMEQTESEPQTPKRKKVRGLYSQSVTLDLESELDITEDGEVEVDASCLMSRSASIETPVRRERKDTTELAADDCFAIPEVPGAKSQVSPEPKSTEEGETHDVSADNQDKQDESETPNSPEKAVSSRKSKSPRAKTVETESPQKSGKSPQKSPKRSSRSKSKEAEKQTRSASKSPKQTSKSPGRTPKSPGKTAKSPGKTAKSPEKTAKSPGRTAKSPGKTAKSPEKMAKSPEKGSKKAAKTDEKSAKSPDSASKKGSDKTVKNPVKTSKNAAEKQSKNPEKQTNKAKTPEKSPKKGIDKSVRRDSSKSPSKSASSKSPATRQPRSTERRAHAKASTITRPSRSPVKKSVSVPAEKRKASKSPVKTSANKKSRSRSSGANSPKVNKESPQKTNVRSGRSVEKRTASKSPEATARKVTRAASTNKDGEKVNNAHTEKSPSKKQTEQTKRLASTAVRSTKIASPRTVAKEDGKRAKVVLQKVDAKESRSSRNTRTAPTKNTVEPEITTNTRPALRKPTAKASPRNVKDARLVPDTPESQTSRSSRASSRSVVNTPDNTKSVAETPSPRNVRPARLTTNKGTPGSGSSPALRPARAAHTVASETKKQASKTTRTGQSSTNSPITSPPKKSKTDTKKVAAATPVQSQTSTESDSEEDQIVRRARPSRKNTTRIVGTPVSIISTPGSAGSLTRNQARTRGSVTKKTATPKSSATDSDNVFDSPASVTSSTMSSSRRTAATRVDKSKTYEPTKQNLERQLRAGAKDTKTTTLRRPQRSRTSEKK